MSCTPSNPGMQTPCPTCPPGETGESIAQVVPGAGGTFTVTGTKGTNFGTFTAPPGAKGDPGVGTAGRGIATVVAGANGTFTVTGTDGQTLGTFTAPKGDSGVGIASVVAGTNGTFTVTGTDGQTLGTFTAPKGDPGVGTAGVGITGATLDASGNLILTRSDGTTISAGQLPRFPVSFSATTTGLKVCTGVGCMQECQEVAWTDICTQLAASGCELGPATACTTPTVSAALSPTAMIIGAAYSGTVKVANATSATVAGLPTGVTASALVGDTITVAGTPTAAAGSFAVTVSATNACGGGSTTSSASGLTAGTASLSAAPVCPTPTVSATINPTTMTIGIAYNGTVKVANATSATVAGLPTGVTASALVGDTITLSGTVTASASNYAITVNATNACGGGSTTSSASGLAAGTVTVYGTTPNVVSVSTPVIDNTAMQGGTVNVLTPAVITGDEPITVTCQWYYSGGILIGGATSCTEITNAPSGNIYLEVSATNGTSSDAKISNICAVGLPPTNCPTPTVTSALSPATFVVGTTYTGTITFANTTSVTISGLPAGLTADPISNNTVMVYGIPTTSGAFTVTANATNACGGGNVTSTASGLAVGSGTVVEEVFATDCCGVQVLLIRVADASVPGAVYYATSPYGFPNVAGSCGYKTVMYFDANLQSVYEVITNNVPMAECP